jgi:hypothetical protein
VAGIILPVARRYPGLHRFRELRCFPWHIGISIHWGWICEVVVGGISIIEKLSHNVIKSYAILSKGDENFVLL